MRKLFVFLAVLSLAASPTMAKPDNRQETKVTVVVNQAPLSSVFASIEKQSDFLFNFVDADVASHVVTLSLAQVSIDKALEAALAGTDLTYSIDNRHITISRRKAEAATLSGIVRQSDGQPLWGATVLIVGTTTGSVTGEDGSFSIPVKSSQTGELEFNCLGFETQRLPIVPNKLYDVTLLEESQKLEEVVVIGYGSARKKDLTGSISRVIATEKADVPNVNALQMLNGMVPGLRIVDTGRAGAESASIEIRGTTSINASNEPLIVLDGVPYAGYLSDINTNDIETIDVLKDASSTAIYGSRGANGVIMITTKKGTSETPRLNYKGYYGLSNFAHTPKLMNADQYVALRAAAEQYKGISIPFNEIELANIEAGKTIDAWDVISRIAPMTEHELSVSGRASKINYYLSGAYTNQSSPIIGDDFQRLTVRSNFSVDIADWLKIGTNTGFTFRTVAGEIASWSNAAWLSPYSSIRYDDGQLRLLPYGDTMVQNPLWGVEMNNSAYYQYNISSNNYALVKLPLKGLTYRLNLAVNLRFAEENFYKPSYERDGSSWLGSGNKKHTRNNYLLVENILKYERSFGKHNIDATMMYGFDKSQGNGSTLSNSDIFNDTLGYNGLNLGMSPQVSTSASYLASISSMARLGYRYADRYMFMATVRRDGFSAFGPGHKFGVFPSLGASWVVSEEDFFPTQDYVNMLKMRLSWGKNGNRAVSYSNNYLSAMYTLQTVFGDEQYTGIYPGKMENPDLGWETSASWNLGFDVSAFAGRLNATIDVYRTRTTDLLLSLKIPNMSGYTDYLTNVGETSNRGIEIGLNSVNVRKGDFSWESGLTFTLNRNRIEHLSGQDLDNDGKEDDDINSNLFIGYSLGSNFDYVYDGIWQEWDDFATMPTAKPGDIRFKDISGNGSIGPEDRVVQHNNRPDFVMGLSNTFKYKDFGLSFMLDFRYGGYASNSWLCLGKNYYDRTNQLDIPYWTLEVPRSDYPSVGYSNPLNWGFYESLTYLRLSDLTFNWRVPKNLANAAGMHGANLYVSGKNLLTLTGWHGWDPEHAKGGRGSAYGPLMRSVVVGVQIEL
ncbi:MAG: TonB-dependent receptor [Bacteroidales bacterium]|nr:TonB-dependent receptor [Candidatus Cryptobacteroides aphodequi]